MTVRLGDDLRIADVVAVARDGEPVELPTAARDTVEAGHDALERVLSTDRRLYGVNTGFGDLQDEDVDRAALEELQRNLLRSTDAAVGDPVDTEVVRAALLVRANSLASGVSGVRPIVVDQLVSMLNEGVHPLIRAAGSTDDLGAVANVGLVMIGEGRAEYRDDRVAGSTALDRAGLDPISVGPKEGLAVINGPFLMTGMTALAIADIERLVRTADVIGAVSFDRIGTHPGAFHPRVFEHKPLPGAATAAANIRASLDLDPADLGAEDLDQDPLSLRCIPQLSGAVRDMLANARDTVETEINGASDNPLVFPNDDVVSSGSYSGLHVAAVTDSLTPVVQKMGIASERRTDKLLTADDATAFLASAPGTESGLMVAQYTSAGLLAGSPSSPVGGRSVTVSGGQEDLHSLGTIGARRLRDTIASVRRVLAVELLCAVRYQLLADRSTDRPISVVDSLVGPIVRPLSDSPIAGRIEEAAELICSGALLDELADQDVSVQ